MTNRTSNSDVISESKGNLRFFVAGGLALVIFLVDMQSQKSLAVGYVLVVAIAQCSKIARHVLAAATLSLILTFVAAILALRTAGVATVAVQNGLALTAIAVTTYLCLQTLPGFRGRLKDKGEGVSDASLTELQGERAKLAASQQRSQLMFEASLDAVITIDQSGSVTDWNNQAEQTFGWSKSEATGRLLTDLIIPERYRDAHRRGLEHYRLTGEGPILNQRLELYALNRNGTEFPVELTIVPLPLDSGEQFCAYVRDVTHAKKVTADLGERESRIRALLDSTAEGIYGLDLEGNCTFANSACARLLGYESADDFVNQNMHRLIHHSKTDGSVYAEDECQIYLAFQKCEGVNVDNEVFWRKDGTSFPVEYWSYPLTENGDLVGSVVTFLDISERISLTVAQRELTEKLEQLVATRTDDLSTTRDRLELTLVGANVGLWDWNATNDEVTYSTTYKRQLGYPPETDWNKFQDWESRLHPDDVELAHQMVAEYFEHRSPEYKSTFRMRCKDGSYRWMLAQGKAVFDSDGKPLRMTGVHVDITERRESERELKRLNDALQEANLALQESNVELQQFAYVASHDLQTPLRAIAGFSQFLQSDFSGRLDARADDYISRIVRGVKRMQKMIDDLLQFSRVESRAAPFEQISLNDVYADAIELLNASVVQFDAEVTRDDLPMAFGDPAQLTQLLMNLIGNAIKYHREKPVVHVSTTANDNEVTLSVKDNGIGIADVYHERIFEVFRRLHTSSEYPGTGIGLAVCRRIVKRHGGRIWVESAEGVGSTFHVTLPVLKDSIDEGA
ncbi:Phytochrome-like protein cph1 [Rubripirellula amarantea]|uniref:histidine kinase n=1 Tax=Rubripirellula amarantea TaxID=2527999 RepID=A0A5C5WMW3_9BACT|nr:PAS domain S-box protein [Rubripirellula amarantea]TWT51132.1 Phytochrome-like protein cph1 [Rubripirellula amarantea]